ncbi:MAG: T9SS type A sorting domain-containing protein [Flavobacteriales bacterium]|nr:T9SS type A sorting domain-containing protein [Flavobacteriales bacterium]
MKKRVSITSVFIFLTHFLYAQSADNLMNEIRLVSTSEFVRLDWEILAGNTCFGIDIERSTDKKNFTQIGHIAGTCGGVDIEPYFFIDSFPVKNVENCYRVILGLQGNSSAKCLEYLEFKNGYHIRINAKQISFIFEDSYAKEDISFFDIAGKKVVSETINGTTFNLDVNSFPTGIYFFKLRDLSDTKFFIP